MNNQVKAPHETITEPHSSPSVQEDYRSPIQKRIKAWREKKAKEETGVRFKPALVEGDEKRIRMGTKVKNIENLSASEQIETLASLYSAISGSGTEEYSRLFLSETLEVLLSGSSHDHEQIANAFHGAMLGMDPKDIIESQLCSRLLVLHSKAMYFIKEAACAEYEKVIDSNINRATKLMRLHNETLEALNRHRRKGEQKVTVQHVHVNKGGQAVVASEFTPGGGNSKNTKE